MTAVDPRLAEHLELLANAASVGYDTALRDVLVDRLREAQTRVAARRDRTAVSDWLDSRRRLIREALGVTDVPLRPHPKDVIVRELDRGDVVVEKRVVELIEGMDVPVDVYRPKGRGPWPLVLHVPGHWIENGRLTPDLQRNALALARSGMLVALFDPMDQGERFSSWHVHQQAAPLLVGLTQTGIMLAEGGALMAHLADREDVDGARRAVTGASGGGLQSLYFPLVDEGLCAIVPVCYIVELVALVEALEGVHWNSAGDLCNQVPGLGDYATMADLITLGAPVPLCAINAREDAQFPIAGARRAVESAQPIYTALDAPGRLRLVEVPGPHAYGREATVAAHDFLRDVFGLPPVACPAVQDHELQIPPCRVDYISFAGSSADVTLQTLEPSWEPESRVLEHTQDGRSATVALARGLLRRDPPREPPDAGVVRSAFGLYDPEGVRGDIRRVWEYGAHRLEALEIQPERGVTLDGLLAAPRDPRHAAPLLLAFGMDGAAAAVIQLKALKLLAHGWAVGAVDLRGTGRRALVEFDAASIGLILERHLFAQRAADVRGAVEYFFSRSLMAPRLDRSRIVLAAADAPTELLVAAVATTDARVAGAWAATRYDDWDDLFEVDSPSPTFTFVPRAARRIALREWRKLPGSPHHDDGTPDSGLVPWLCARFGRGQEKPL